MANHSKKFNDVRSYYKYHMWKKRQVVNAVKQGWITEYEYEEITGESYPVQKEEKVVVAAAPVTEAPQVPVAAETEGNTEAASEEADVTSEEQGGHMSIEAYSLLKNGNMKLSEHFKVREFHCRDGSDPIFVDTELVEILEKIRTHFNKPVTITSAFRTAAHNATVAKAAKYSQHLYGKAADIQVQGISVEQVYAYADKLLAGRGGVGIYPPGLGRANGWVHVDVRKEKSRWRG